MCALYFTNKTVPDCDTMNDIEDSSDWSSMYGEVVWAKAKSFPWWPSYVYDPLEMPADKAVVRQATKLVNKQYAIYYYGDGSFGFVLPKFIKPFNPENTAEFAKQTVPKKYMSSFGPSITVAESEAKLPKSERVSWHTVPDQPVKAKKQKKKMAKNSTGSGSKYPYDVEPSADDENSLYFRESDDSGDSAEESDVTVETDDDYENQVQIAVNQGKKRGRPPKSTVGSTVMAEIDVVSVKRGRGRPRLSNTVSKTATKSESTTQCQEQAESIVSSNKKRRVIDEKEEETVEFTPSLAPVVPHNFDEESRDDRLQRLVRILRQCCDVGSVDEVRAVKTIDKLASMSLSLAEMKSSGAGKLVTELRKHSTSARIAEAARVVREKWMQSAGVSKPDAGIPDGAANQSVPSLGKTNSLAAVTEPPVTVSSTPLMNGADLPKSSERVAAECNLMRSNAVKLLLSALNDRNAAEQFEDDVFQVFGGRRNCYLECITRFSGNLQKPEFKAAYDCLLSNSRTDSLKGNNPSQQSSVDVIKNSFVFLSE